jgi:hypothetical protein
LLGEIEARQFSTVLCLGNGSSPEPHLLAAAGLKVTALDISPVATALAYGFALGPREIERHLGPTRGRRGGCVDFIVGDLMDASVCSGPFEVVIERRTLQLFPKAERRQALEAVTSRLVPRGILLTHCHDGNGRPPRQPTHVIEPLLSGCGFEVRYLMADHSEPATSSRQIAFVVTTTG